MTGGPVDVHAGILRPEMMLRMAEAEKAELRAALEKAAREVVRLRGQLHQAQAEFCALILQAGGTATVAPEELARKFTVKVRQDPATQARTYTVSVDDPGPKITLVES